ncbi:peptidylprolyl isomerase [Enterococcus sp. BWB1-3]|uniref:peptidylprolyl isomerase n=1 Tax=unclassified Enterococcus TaxID=2608891 RepID=UPI001924671A|nr:MULTISPECIES: peptidylprolyl isomerase [unclassified Enterococcus]MBL1228711.1 peptidylprolyl isomerase [Enterococcus sp. BWB1-3]MCB5952783.1 peptidylprolyl isomerase [Enterococcus sp. BWT-B8]
MKKKLILAAASAMAVFTLAACSGGSDNIATMKGSTITVEDFYDRIKNESTSQSTVANMIIFKVFEDKYGDKVTDKEIDAEFNKTKESAEAQGYNFDDYLSEAGYTTKSYKALIKQGLAYQKGLEANVDVTETDIKTAWTSFHPEVEAQIITVATEDEAKEIKAELDKDGDFTKIAKEKSTDTTKEDGGKVTFDSTSTTIPAAVQEAAYKLKDGEVSEPVSATDSTGYQTIYYLVKMTKTSSKGNDLEPYREQLEEIAKETQMADQTFTSKVISDELTAANVKIKDDAFKNVLSGYMQTESSSTATEESSSSSSEKSSDSSETESSSSTTESSK